MYKLTMRRHYKSRYCHLRDDVVLLSEAIIKIITEIIIIVREVI